MNFYTIILSCLCMFIMQDPVRSYPLPVSSNFASLSPSQIDQLCSYVSHLPPREEDASESTAKRFAVPFPDMNRFLSTSHKLHHHKPTIKSGVEASSPTKHDFHAYLCSITKDSEEMTNFLTIFIEEHGEPPAFNLFESCEEVSKRDLSQAKDDQTNEVSSAVRLNELSQFCSNRPQSRFVKRWKHSADGPISIDFIHQMLESRKVKSYPYPAEMDPYLVGR